MEKSFNNSTVTSPPRLHGDRGFLVFYVHVYKPTCMYNISDRLYTVYTQYMKENIRKIKLQ